MYCMIYFKFIIYSTYLMVQKGSWAFHAPLFLLTLRHSYQHTSNSQWMPSTVSLNNFHQPHTVAQTCQQAAGHCCWMTRLWPYAIDILIYLIKWRSEALQIKTGFTCLHRGNDSSNRTWMVIKILLFGVQYLIQKNNIQKNLQIIQNMYCRHNMFID